MHRSTLPVCSFYIAENISRSLFGCEARIKYPIVENADWLTFSFSEIVVCNTNSHPVQNILFSLLRFRRQWIVTIVRQGGKIIWVLKLIYYSSWELQYQWISSFLLIDRSKPTAKASGTPWSPLFSTLYPRWLWWSTCLATFLVIILNILNSLMSKGIWFFRPWCSSSGLRVAPECLQGWRDGHLLIR